MKHNSSYEDNFSSVEEALKLIREVGFEKFRTGNEETITKKEVSALFLFNEARTYKNQEMLARQFLSEGIEKEVMGEIEENVAESIFRQQRRNIAENTPPYISLSYIEDAKQEFFVHFTSEENLNKIVAEGFKFGVTQLNGLQQTIGDSAAYNITGVEPGYNFACVPGEAMSYPENNPTKGMLVIKTDAVIVFHSGDLEKQAVFWGKDAPLNEVVPLELLLKK